MARSTTIAAIAKDAGVSVPTVSKVLNGRPDVSPATRARVEEAIERHGYTRRRARSVVGPPLVDLVMHQLDFAWSVEVITGIEQVCAEAKVGVVLSELGGAHHPSQEWLDAVLARKPLAVILVQTGLDQSQRRQLAARSIPAVVVDTAGELPTDMPTVGSANWNGGLAATRHLLGLGHRRVGMITGRPDVLCSRARVDGYGSAHDEAGIPVDPALVRNGNFSVEAGYRNAGALLDLPDPPTAIFAGNDLQALGVLRATHERGLRVPEDLSVVGYDDLPLAAWLCPPLTTVRQPLQKMASTAARMVLDLANGTTPPNLRIDLATELVLRASTAPPPRG